MSSQNPPQQGSGYTPADLRAELPRIQESIAAFKASQRFKRSKRADYWFGPSRAGVCRLFFATHFYRLRKMLMPLPALRRADIEEIGIFGHGNLGFIPLIDLGALPLETLREGALDLECLTRLGIKRIALMEDRDPYFFLNFEEYDATEPVPLNRHGTGGEQRTDWTMADMKAFIDLAHQHGIEVYQGFWANTHYAATNPFLSRNSHAEPVILGSDDMNPLCEVTDAQGETMLFAEYIIRQYHKLADAFGIDGLFLGDGFMGYRSFLRPRFTGDFTFAQKGWEIFYALLSDAVRARGGKFMAYDVMGRTYEEAYRSGVDYKTVLPYLDLFMVQTYGQTAWHQFMSLPGYTLMRDLQALESMHRELAPDMREKLVYTAELGDKIEGWRGTPMHIKKQFEVQGPFVNGVLGVWSNELVYEILTGICPATYRERFHLRISPKSFR